MYMNKILLEYKEKTGQFHYNVVEKHRPETQPNTYGWESIAFTEEEKATIFCDILYCIGLSVRRTVCILSA